MGELSWAAGPVDAPKQAAARDVVPAHGVGVSAHVDVKDLVPEQMECDIRRFHAPTTCVRDYEGLGVFHPISRPLGRALRRIKHSRKGRGAG